MEVNHEEFIQAIVGPDSIDLTPSSEGYTRLAFVIHNTDRDGTVSFVDKSGCQHLANHELFSIARFMSPLPPTNPLIYKLLERLYCLSEITDSEEQQQRIFKVKKLAKGLTEKFSFDRDE